MNLNDLRFDLPSLRSAYASGAEVSAVIAEAGRRDLAWADPALWIHKLNTASLATHVDAVASASVAGPLHGVPFAIKDNIDLAGVPTTAACPAFSTTPAQSAFVVEKLIRAGAVPLGKANLDQFATGLVGVRSPYGIPMNAIHPEYIPGGSSSGSATAVAAGICAFSLGTDTAGSGRVPAALNELVGVKPTRGLLSTRGLVPACKSLDCLSIFARTISDAAEVLKVAAGYDDHDPYSRRIPRVPHLAPKTPRIGVPKAEQREFHGDGETAALFEAAITKWRELGAQIVEIDYSPFRDTARLLYEGPWVAERLAVAEDLLKKDPDFFHPVTRQIIEGAHGTTAVQTFRALYRLEGLRREAQKVWNGMDAMLTPTIPTVYKVTEVLADPIRLNSRLGHYTNHFNLLDLCGLAVPFGRVRDGGVPWGVTLSAPAFHDDVLLDLGARFLGENRPVPALVEDGPKTRLAVCGAHLSGLPLNTQLLQLGARLVSATRTAPGYKLFALPNTTPPKPGLLRVSSGGSAVEMEVWELSVAAYGEFVAAIPGPLGIGTLSLEDGTQVQGFLCEASACEGAKDISTFGGWRAYLRSLGQKA